jgi:nitrilase
LAKEQDSPFKVAAAQLSPVFMDRSATLEKACEAIREAGREGAKIVVFPEAFVPCYPDWVWPIPPSQEGQHRALYGEFLDQSVTIPGPDTEKIGRAAKAGGTFVVIGVNERNDGASGGSIYNTLLFFDDKGSLMGIHRKLVPTSAERLVWTPGDGSTLGGVRYSVWEARGTDLLGELYAVGAVRDVCLGNSDLRCSDVGQQRGLAGDSSAHSA